MVLVPALRVSDVDGKETPGMLHLRLTVLRTIGLLAVALTGLGLAAVPSGADPSRPVPATAAQAQHAKAAADHSVAALRARISAAAHSVAKLTAAAGRAEDQYNAQLARQAQSRAAEAAARAAVAAAQQRYDAARESLVSVVVAYYESGGPAGNSIGTTSTASLFTASDPGEVIQDGADREMITRFQTQVTAQMTAAVAARHSAEAQQRQALQRMQAQTAKLAALRQQATHALATAKTTMSRLRADLRAAKLTQAQAAAVLSAFVGGWSSADPGRAGQLNSTYKHAALVAARHPLAPKRAHWTPQMGQSAANRAMRWIGTPYAWAGGNAAGPTRGVCAGGDAAHDCQVVGFDCSGLAAYAWAPYRGLSHFAATQYGEAGRVHPAPNQLRAGDLLFWSSDGTVAGIHHVAIYVGGGNVVQAPQSGDIVRITPVGLVSSGYFGATRPLS
jgi:cell wall-associated NlpC family hydrolase